MVEGEKMPFGGLADFSAIDFSAIYAVFHEGVIVVDVEGRIAYYNETQGRIDDLSPHEVVGKRIVEVYDLTPTQSTTMRCLKSGRPVVNQPIFYRTRLGRFANVVSNVYPIYSEGRVVGAVSFTKDYQMVEKIISSSSATKKPRVSGSGTRYSFADVVGSSPGLLAAMQTARMAAGSPSPVMIIGETGTGKEIFAQAVHNHASRQRRSFIPINCAAIPENLLEGILFGTTRGAFTGAVDRPGLFEKATAGTLFLDELNAMPLSLQAKLLRVAQEKSVRRIGALVETPVDLKIISSLSEDPYHAMRHRTLRKDLFYRLGVVIITLPPLRERRKDLPALTKHFIGRSNRVMKRSVASVSTDVMQVFRSYPWPGNVRELAHVIEGAMNVVDMGDRLIRLEHLPRHIQAFSGNAFPASPSGCRETPAFEPDRPLEENRVPASMETLERAKNSVEAEAIRRALSASNGNVARAARMLGLFSAQTLHYKLKKYGFDRKDFILR